MDERIRQMGRGAREAVLETLWPTRCAVCDAQGALLCAECVRSLPFIDQTQACPRCGSARGRVQCCTCNSSTLGSMGCESLPFDGCVSALELDERTGRIATLYKDGGERRLAEVMAAFVESVIAPEWKQERPFISYVSASEEAYRRRGFDHAELLAHAVADRLKLPGGALFLRPGSCDQRVLSRGARLANMNASLHVNPCVTVAPNILLIDDVFTTGATLFAASRACKQAGARIVRCATFARTDFE